MEKTSYEELKSASYNAIYNALMTMAERNDPSDAAGNLLLLIALRDAVDSLFDLEIMNLNGKIEH